MFGHVGNTGQVTCVAGVSKQPMFNFAKIDCNKQSAGMGRSSFECTITQASVYANSDKPSTDNPNCSLDLDIANI